MSSRVLRQRCMACGTPDAPHQHEQQLCIECCLNDIWWDLRKPALSRAFALARDDEEYQEIKRYLLTRQAKLRALRRRARKEVDADQTDSV